MGFRTVPRDEQPIKVTNLTNHKATTITIKKWWGWEKIKAEVLLATPRVGIVGGQQLLAVMNTQEARLFEVCGAEQHVQPGVFREAPPLGRILLTAD